MLFAISGALQGTLAGASAARLAEVSELWIQKRAAKGEVFDPEVMAELLSALADPACSLVPADGTTTHYARLREPLERATQLLRARHPDIPVTYSVGEPWPDELDDLPEQAQIAHFYVYGVLGALYEAVGLGHGTETAAWPTSELAAMLRPDALWLYEKAAVPPTGTGTLSTAPDSAVGFVTPYRAVVTNSRSSPGCRHTDVG
ncbi:hypothetical protein [Streptomyces sp. NBC_00005]|uniref:hypothetical protein n=1 Tax=Streptomyces sp. NBC_00005 TaxID=2903609 RepID=UPI0032446FD2